jgi:hypothetical protein
MSFYSSETYYRTLGLSAGASDNEIKQAYRLKAKRLHPDRNPSPNAHQEFILLTEAYEYLINHRHSETSAQQYTQYTYQPTYQPPDSSRWQNEARERARRQAAEHASMRYEEFVDTDYYKSLQSVETVFRYLFILLLILLFVGICTFLVASSGWLGVFFSALFLIVPVTLVYSRLKEDHLDLTDLHESGVYLLRQKWFLSILFTVFNFYAIVRFGFNTLIGLWSLPGIYLVAIFCAMLAADRLTPTMSIFHKAFYSFCAAPLVISLMFSLNFLFAHHSVEETIEYTYLRNGESNHIHLKGYKYSEYPFLTTFTNGDELADNDRITYTFADGLLGMRVVKSYRFEKD